MNEKSIIRRVLATDPASSLSALHPVLRRVIAMRSCQYTHYQLEDLLRPDRLSNIDTVVDRLITHRDQQSIICVIGDYDCDGATATAVAVRGLKMLGFKHLNYLIPNRFKSGYGLSPDIVHQALSMPDRPDVLLTVDNGISSIDGVLRARDENLDVIITDHHLPGGTLPDTPYIINPQLVNDDFPSKSICGVGVIFYVLLALRSRMKSLGMLENPINMMPLLDLVTLGTIADCVPLDQNNRTLIHHGLQRFRKGHVSAGLRALCDQAGVRLSSMNSVDLAFRVAPKLNAAGRMDDMSIGVRCLLSDDPRTADMLAKQLVNFNIERLQVQDSMQQQAIRMIQKKPLVDRSVIILYHPDWHQGVIGILASRIKESYHKPCIVFAPDGDHEVKGSGRSIDGIHLRDLLDQVATKTNLIHKFGGHAMAAGLSLSKCDLDAFSTAINTCVQSYPLALFTPSIQTDGPLANHEITIDTAQALLDYGIWGHSYPEPVFDNVFRVQQKRMLKDKHLKLRLVSDQGCYDAIWFFCPDDMVRLVNCYQSYRFFYRLSINTYLGERNLNLLIEYLTVVNECEVIEEC